jgi:hypothetical protein
VFEILRLLTAILTPVTITTSTVSLFGDCAEKLVRVRVRVFNAIFNNISVIS